MYLFRTSCALSPHALGLTTLRRDDCNKKVRASRELPNTVPLCVPYPSQWKFARDQPCMARRMVCHRWPFVFTVVVLVAAVMMMVVAAAAAVVVVVMMIV
jgi:hypothetical protein